MRLRDILIGAFATMIVTIIGGVVVYYYNTPQKLGS